jgi:hypothetical protein
LEGLNPRRCGEWGIDVRGDKKCMKAFNINPEGETFLIDEGTDVRVIFGLN